MDKELYEFTQHMIFNIVRQTSLLHLADFLNAIDRAETFGPILDPSLYQDYLFRGGKENLDLLKQIAAHLLEINNLVAQAKPVAPAEVDHVSL